MPLKFREGYKKYFAGEVWSIIGWLKIFQKRGDLTKKEWRKKTEGLWPSKKQWFCYPTIISPFFVWNNFFFMLWLMPCIFLKYKILRAIIGLIFPNLFNYLFLIDNLFLWYTPTDKRFTFLYLLWIFFWVLYGLKWMLQHIESIY